MTTLKFTTKLPKSVRDEFIRKLKNFCFLNDVVIDVEEDRKYKWSNYRISMTGSDSILKTIKSNIERIMSSLSGEVNE